MAAYILHYLMLCASMLTAVFSQSLSCANPADIMFLLDGSDSIDQQEWIQERSFVARMINALDISSSTINVGFAVYSSDIDKLVGLMPFRHKVVLEAMAKMLEHPTGIATNTAKGIAKVREIFNNQPASRNNAPKIMIVITDGSSENPAETIRQAQLTKADGIRIIAVGVGNNIFLEELKEIASNQRKLYLTPDFAALRGIETEIKNMICKVIKTTPVPRITFVQPTIPPAVIPIATDKMCNNPGDIVFVIDGSDSISDADFIRLKSFVANLIDNFEIGSSAIHVGIIVYSTLVGEKIGLYPPKNKLILKALTTNLKHPKFGTDTAAGIEAAREMIRDQGRANAPEIIVVITDGRSTNPRNTIVQASNAKAQGITMIAIGVGSDIFSEELNQIASSQNLVSEVADFRSLENTVNVMRNLICTSITTTTATTTTMLPPTPPPFIDPPREGLICNVPGDVVFVLDGSDSIQRNDWIRQRNFVANLINNLEVGQPYIHISVLVYSSQIGEVVPLVPFKSKSVLTQNVKNLAQPRFGTDTALGIQKAREILKSQGRPNAPNVIIVVTDGKSTYPDNTMKQASMAKADGITMISVGVGSDIFKDELYDIASSQSQVFEVTDFASLRNIIGILRDKICQVVQSTTTPAPTVITQTVPTITEMATPAPVLLIPCEESRTEADVMFLIDGTNAINPYNWMLEKHFISNFLDGLHVGEGLVHAGIVISSHGHADFIGVSPFKSRSHLQELIQGLLHPSGDMDTANGLRKVQEIFRNQARRNAQKLMIFISDGSSRSMAETDMEGTRLKEDGVAVASVGIGDKANMAEITSLASNPSFTLRTNLHKLPDALPQLQNVVCEILKRPETTTKMPTTAKVPGLCDGCLIDQGVGFNPYPGDCTKYVQCWTQGDTVMSLVRSCPFGQFWDTDAITCRPSLLVQCTADPCKLSSSGFTYGMSEYGCRAYFKCIDGFSVGYCCPQDSAYVEGMGCLESTSCNEECPPYGGVAVKPICKKKSHWDNRYYIEIIYEKGEIVRPCPLGTIFYEDKCECDFGLSGLLPDRTDVLCQQSAYFPFNQDLMDHSLNRINVGVTNVMLTDLGTAFFNGQSEINLWRFAGTDWGSKLVIKFKFRYDYSNKFIDYGGIPVDLSIDLDVNMNLISNYHMTDMDWRLWDQLRKVTSLDDWRQLLREFGQSRTFYILLGALGFKPGTSHSLQVARILGTPEAFFAFRGLLMKLKTSNTNINERNSISGLKEMLTHLRSLKGLIKWDTIIKQLKGDNEDFSARINISGGTSGTTGLGGTSVGPGIDAMLKGTGEWRWDTALKQWVKVRETASGGGSHGWQWNNSNILNIEGTQAASDWRWNNVTGRWERLASVHGGKGFGSNANTHIHNWHYGGPAVSAEGSMHQWKLEAESSHAPIPGSSSLGSGNVNSGGSQAWADLIAEITRLQNSTSSAGSWQWSTKADRVGGSMNANMDALEKLLAHMLETNSPSSAGSWQWNTQGGRAGGSVDANIGALEKLLAQMLETNSTSNTGSWQWSTRADRVGGSVEANRDAIEKMLAQLNLAERQGGSASWRWNTSVGATSDTHVDATQLDAILKQLMDMSQSIPSFNTSGAYVASASRSAVVSGGGGGEGSMGFRYGFNKQPQVPSDTMKTVRVQTDREQPYMVGGRDATVVGGRIVGGKFESLVSTRGPLPGTISGDGQSMGAFKVEETSSRREGGQTSGQIGGQTGRSGGSILSGHSFVSHGQRPSSNANTLISLVKQTVQGDSLPDRTALRGAEARGVKVEKDSRIIGINVPTDADFISGATVIGKNDKTIRVTDTQPQIRIEEIVQEVNPIPFEAAVDWSSGGASQRGESSQVIGMAGGDFTQMGKVVGSGGGTQRIVETSVKRIPGEFMAFASGGEVGGGVSQESIGDGKAFGTSRQITSSVHAGGSSSPIHSHRSNHFVSQVGISGDSGIAGGDFTQMGKVVGTGGGIKRIVDTNVKRIPGGQAQFNAEGGLTLESLGLGGADGTNIVRHTLRVEPAESSQFIDAGTVDSSGFNVIGSSSGTSGTHSKFMSQDALGGRNLGGGHSSFMSAGTRNRLGDDHFRGLGSLSPSAHVNVNPLPFLTGESAENFIDGLSGKRRRRRSIGHDRTKRAINKQAYQALVTNCQGENGQPSIMIVSNHNDVQFALKTYGSEPAVVSVPLVEGWNDVTLIYDGRSLTGVVENWKGLQKASVSLTGNIERRQAGLLVGSCQGFTNFHGEIDDLSVYNCLSPAIIELRDRTVL